MRKFERIVPYPNLPGAYDMTVILDVMVWVNDMLAESFGAEYSGVGDNMILVFNTEEDFLFNVLAYGDEDLRRLYEEQYVARHMVMKDAGWV